MVVGSEGVKINTALFMFIDIAVFGVGNDDIYIVKSRFAGMFIPKGILNPILVLTEDAVNVLTSVLYLICPSIGKSLKLLNPYGKVINNQSFWAIATVHVNLTVK